MIDFEFNYISYRFLQVWAIFLIGKSVAFSSIAEAKTSKKDDALKKEELLFVFYFNPNLC